MHLGAKVIKSDKLVNTYLFSKLAQLKIILNYTIVAEALQAAIACKTDKYKDIHPGMAKTARDEGFDEIADWFETLAKAERSHANKFTKTLEAHLANA